MVSGTLDYSGQQCGPYTVLCKTGKKGKRGVTIYLCECVCGKILEIPTGKLPRYKSKACICHKRGSLTHGLGYHPYINIWHSMRYRCYNPENKDYHNYGGRGIKICDEWLDPITGARAFIEWVESQPDWLENVQIDRIDNNGPYSPDNCRLVSQKENANNRRDTIKVSINGVEHSIREAAVRYSKEDPDFVCEKVRHGYSVCDSLFTPRRGSGYVRISIWNKNPRKNLRDLIVREAGDYAGFVSG